MHNVEHPGQVSGRHVTIRLGADVLARHPSASACWVATDGLSSVAANLTPERLSDVWERAASAVAAAGITMETIVDQPSVLAWRDATRSAGLKPANFRSSVEALTRRVLKDGKLVTTLPLVDAYCAISVMHQAPLGAWDLARLPVPDIHLRLARPATDRYVPLGAEPGQMPISDRVVVYAASHTILCWNFNHRDSAETSLVEGTGRAVFVSEALDEAGRERSRAALDEIRVLITSLGGVAGTVEWAAPLA